MNCHLNGSVFLGKNLRVQLQVHKLLRGSHARMWTIRLRLHGKALNAKAMLLEEGDKGIKLHPNVWYFR